MSVKDAKIYEPETTEDADLPESTSWDEISEKPETLSELDSTAATALESASQTIANLGDLAYEDFVTEVLGPALNTQTKLILGEFQFQDAGAIAMKTDANNGLWLSPTGLLGKKAGATTFAIDTAGNATFSGSVTGATISGGTITGSTIQTASTGYRIRLAPGGSYQDSLMFMSGNDVLSTMQVNTFPKGEGVYWTCGTAEIGLVESIYKTTAYVSDGLGFVEIADGETHIGTDGVCSLLVYGTGVEIDEGDLTIKGNITATVNNTYSLGSTTYKWANVHAVAMTLNGTDLSTTLTGKASRALSNLSSVSINASLLFDSNNSYDVGSSSNYARSVYANSIEIRTGGYVNNPRAIYFESQTGSPSVGGEMRYYNSGGTQQMRVKVGTFVGSIDLTAV